MTFRFGDFALERTTGELRRGGEVVRLQPQPAQVLAILVERAGEVVSREALRDAVWGAGTFVDFDKGLNFAVAQVRAALGDTADTPTFIRTLPKRGYQFIARVTRDDDDVWLKPGSTSGADTAPEAKTTLVVSGSIRTFAVRHAWALAAALLAAVTIGVFAWRATTPPAVAVIAFDNETGAAELDRYAQTVTDALVAELTDRGAGRIGVIGNAAALRTKRPFRDVAAIGRSLHAKYVVIGQVQRDGDRVRLLAHLIRLPEQTHVGVVRIERDASDPPVLAADAARRISEAFLRKLSSA